MYLFLLFVLTSGETKIETDKRVIKDKILLIKKEIEKVQSQRLLHRNSRDSNLNYLPVVTLCGYTNAGKSTLMNRMSNAGVLAEDKLFATLDPTTRKVRINIAPSAITSNEATNDMDEILDIDSETGLPVGNLKDLTSKNNLKRELLITGKTIVITVISFY